MRPRLGLIVYLASAFAVIGALALVTRHTLGLERQARLQEAIRLALWRMDAAIAPLVLRESARPYFHYQAFFPADRAYTRMFQAVQPGEVLVPSPILLEPDPLVKLHFQRVPAFPAGAITSPEAPPGSLCQQAGDAAPTPEQLAVAEQRLHTLQSLLGAPDLNERLTAACMPLSEIQTVSPINVRNSVEVVREAQQMQQQEQAVTAQSLNEYQARQQWNIEGQRAGNYMNRQAADELARKEEARPGGSAGDILDKATGSLESGTTRDNTSLHQGEFFGVWLPPQGVRGGASPTSTPNELLFIRTVRLDADQVLQGFWVDWPALQAILLSSIKDLLPEASIQPVAFDGAATLQGATPASAANRVTANPGQALAAIPAELIVPPGAAASPGLLPRWTPTRTALLLTWLAVLGSLAAVALVLRASAQLAERRGRFVSAVTHELRTPLTTFCLYSQMLSDGMVTDESARRDYLATLKTESMRLAGIVENVLSYARLSRPRNARAPGNGGSHHAADRVSCRGLLGQMIPVLRDRASQSGLELLIQDEAPPEAAINAEHRAVERILYNLVDNAGKYASSAADKRLHITATVTANTWSVAVCDHGPGIPSGEHRRIFDAFARGTAHADSPAQGLGLGLALARGLARELGGNLRLAPTTDGACFVLDLPLTPR